MLQHATIPLKRAWNSWSDRPAEMIFLPLGVRLTPILYSTRSRSTSAIEPRRDTVRLGRHEIDGSRVELEVDHSGTSLSFHWTKPAPFVLCGGWETIKSGEWGLRFWVTLAISSDNGEAVTYDENAGVALIKIGQRYVAIASAEAPVQITGHDSIAALRDDFETNGYFYLGSRRLSAPVLGLRFNLEMMRSGAYAAAVADRADLAIDKARAALFGKTDAEPDLADEALAAIRDIVGWNTIWDETNHRPYTAVTRIWNLGKFAVWYNDQTYAALLAGLFDADLARENMATALAGATPQGNIACIVTSNDAWVDRSQPPLGSLTVWDLYQRSGERSIVEASYEALARCQRWWRANRDPEQRGLLSCGSSDVGEALYKGTAFGARNETGMDNSATHDEAVYDPATRTLSTFDLGLNCVAAVDAEMLANLADVLGRATEAQEFRLLAERSRSLIGDILWDDERKIFANRQRDGGFVRSLSPTSFYPLLCGAASEEQARHLLVHLEDETLFAGEYALPNATRDDPAFAENVYWRGRIWPNVNYLVWLGLKRYGFAMEAEKLARQSFDLFTKSWRGQRIAAENYNATTGEALDQGDTDPFYIWAGLLPLMTVARIVDVDPWQGWILHNRGEDAEIGPMLSPSGPLTATIRAGEMMVSINGTVVVVTDMPLAMNGFSVDEGRLRCRIGPVDRPGTLQLPFLNPDRIVTARLEGKDISPKAGQSTASFAVAAATRERLLDIIF
ncbi:MGH1-like glycoside hydrolase domain-containing protein [Rhizobium sp. NPDC090279]|uniref:MGH1-like glycoside hydrolase domain-containing protein n=1 Tax=Rhizobium sp. NPDC090279 TaxID=3364499 RepID=UPI00383BE667